MKSKLIYKESKREHTKLFRCLIIVLSKLSFGERRSIDMGLTSQPRTTTYPHMFFLSNGPPYPEIRLGMSVSPAIGVTGGLLSNKTINLIKLFGYNLHHTLAKVFVLGSRLDHHHSTWQPIILWNHAWAYSSLKYIISD